MFNDMSSDIKSLYKDITTYKTTTPIGSSSAMIYELEPTNQTYDYSGTMVDAQAIGAYGAIFRIDVVTDSTIPPMCSVKYNCWVNGEPIENKFSENVGIRTNTTTANVYQTASNTTLGSGLAAYRAPAGYWGDSEKKGTSFEVIFTWSSYLPDPSSTPPPAPHIDVKFKVLSTIKAQIRLTRVV